MQCSPLVCLTQHWLPWALVLIPLPPCHCAIVPVNICCSWSAVSVGRLVMPELQVDPPGRALSTPPLCPGEAAGARGVGRNAGRRRRRTGWAQLLAHLPTQVSLLPFLPLASCFFMNMCVAVQKSVCALSHLRTHTNSISPRFCVVPLSDRRTKTRCFWRGWPSLQSIPLARRH